MSNSLFEMYAWSPVYLSVYVFNNSKYCLGTEGFLTDTFSLTQIFNGFVNWVSLLRNSCFIFKIKYSIEIVVSKGIYMHKMLQTIKWQSQWHVITKNVIRNNIVLYCLYDRSWSHFVGVLCYVVLMKIPKPD